MVAAPAVGGAVTEGRLIVATGGGGFQGVTETRLPSRFLGA